MTEKTPAEEALIVAALEKEDAGMTFAMTGTGTDAEWYKDAAKRYIAALAAVKQERGA